MDHYARLRRAGAPSARRDLRGWASLLRVRAWAHFCLLPLASFDLSRPLPTSARALSVGVIIAFALLAFGYLLNAVSDRRMDRGPKNVLGGAPPTMEVWLALATFATIAVALAATGPWTALVATLACLASGIAYSVGPRLKRLPLVGTLANVTSFAPLLFVGAVDDGDASRVAPLAVAFAALLVENQLLHEAADREEDARGRLATSFRVFGKTGAALFAAFFGAIASLVSSTAAHMSAVAVVFALVFAVGFPFVLHRWGDDPSAMQRARFAHRYAALAAGALLFAATRLTS